MHVDGVEHVSMCEGRCFVVECCCNLKKRVGKDFSCVLGVDYFYLNMLCK